MGFTALYGKLKSLLCRFTVQKNALKFLKITASLWGLKKLFSKEIKWKLWNYTVAV